MFEFFRKKKTIHEPLQKQMADNKKLHPLIANLVFNGLSCDMLPDSTGEFGSVSNPIPVNGSIGEIKYLGKLRGITGQMVLFHRIGSVKSEASDNPVDIFELVCLDGTQWNKLHFDFYHPRRSNLVPEGYTLESYKKRMKIDSPFAFGVTSFVPNFPYGLPKEIDSFYGITKEFSRHVQECIDRFSFERPIEEINTTTSFSPEKENDWTKKKLFGKVKSIRETSFSAMKLGGDYVKIFRMQHRFSKQDQYIIFNQHGFKIKVVDCHINYKSLYKYDDKGRIIQKDLFKSDGSFYLKHLYKYNDKEEIIGKNIYFHDGSISSKVFYENNEKGQKKKELIYRSDDNLFNKNTYKYDNNGNIIEEKHYGSGDKCYYKKNYSYDNKGNLIEERRYGSDGKLERTLTIKYLFDKNWNWFKSIQLINNTTNFITEREIEYFD